MLHLLPVIALSLGASAPVSAQQSDAGSETQLQAHAATAAEKVARQDYQGALAEYRAILRIRPDSAETRANAGMMCHLLGDRVCAVANFEIALRSNPKLEAPTLLCGLDLLRLHRRTEALEYLRRAVQMNPHESRATTGLGDALFSLGRTEEALSAYRTSLQLDSADTDAAYGSGLAYLSIMKDAVERLSQVARDSAYSRILVADAKEAQNQWQEAVHILDQIPNSGDLSLPCLSASLGFARLHAGETAQAETEFRKQRPAGVCPLNVLGLARIAFDRGEISAGLRKLETAWESDPMVVEANVDLLWSGLDDSSVSRLRDALERAAASVKPELMVLLVASLGASEAGETRSTVRVGNDSRSADNPESLCNSGHYTACSAALRPRLPALAPKQLLLLAQSAFYSGDADTSLKACTLLLKTHRTEPVALFWKARSAQRLALQLFAVMRRSAPESPHLHFLIAEAYRQQEQLATAREEYLKVLAASPDDVPARVGLARVLMTSDDSKAMALLHEVLALDPKNVEANYLLGDMLVSKVRYAEARPFLKTALAGGDEYSLSAHSLLAHIAYEDGNWREALRELQPCLQYDKLGNYHYRLYEIYKKLGDTPSAAEALRTSRLLAKEGKP
jgi:tetratricopeptide (TPR) repeat protein